jgi:L-alanine-DL-glutamate epimerase-like enolase superfamily enzyme
LKIIYKPFQLEFKHPFVLAHGSRTHTDVVFVEIRHDGITGYGEAALPPYLPETSKSVSNFIDKVDLSSFKSDFNLAEIINYVNEVEPGNKSAKAALDIALHDLYGKLNNTSLQTMWNINNTPVTPCTFTIGIGDKQSVIDKIEESKDFKLYKVKLGGDNDKEMIETLVTNTNKPFCVDINQGWDDKYYALDMIHWLHDKGALLVEQPLKKDKWDDMAWITSQSPLPTIADEAIQGFADIDLAKDTFNGINIKLMKSAGLLEAKRMAEKAISLNMKLLIGCMSESSCAVTAAAHLASFADWADLDGPYLIKNDPFAGMNIENGKIILPIGRNGIGIILR